MQLVQAMNSGIRALRAGRRKSGGAVRAVPVHLLCQAPICRYWDAFSTPARRLA